MTTIAKTASAARRAFAAACLVSIPLAASAATPVALEWKSPEEMPAKMARPFAGFLPDGRFVVAGGSDFKGDPETAVKSFSKDIFTRSADGIWSKSGELPRPVAEGATCETKRGVLCAGGTDSPDGAASMSGAFILTGDGIDELPPLPENVSMCAAAADGDDLFVVASKAVYHLDARYAAKTNWEKIAEVPGPKRAQHVAAVQNGDQKEKVLVVYGGYDAETKEPLKDGHALVLSKAFLAAAPNPALAVWRELAPLPEGTTTIGASFLAIGNQHVLLVGGFGEAGWVRRAVKGDLSDKTAAALGWQRKILAYNAVTGAWCEYGEIAEGDAPRCGAAAGVRPGGTPEEFTLLVAGGEVEPKVRTASVAAANFRKEAKFGAKAWIVVGVYALLMAGMACYFIFKKKDENDYFRGGNRIPWYVAGMSIFATMLSSITFIAIPTQAYLSDWRYFVMAICIFAIAPVAIFYYLPFFCRLGITSAYEYLERRFNLGVRLFGSAAFVVFMVCRVAVVTLLPAIALNAVTGVSIDACILICGVLTMVYCSLGGLEAVIWSDFVQGVVLLGGAIAVLAILIAKTGPEGAHLSTFWSIATEHGKTKMWDFRFLLTEPVFWVVAVQGIVSNLSSYTSDQCVIQRYIATPDENATKRSIWFNGVMSILASLIFYGIGTALFTHYSTNPAMMDVTMPKSDSVFPIFMATELPWWLAGLVIAAIFAATISTLSANLSSASTAVVTDFVKRFNPGISGRAQIRCGQACTYAVGIVGIAAALALARMESRALFDNFNEFIAMLTAGLTGLFFMGVFMPRVKGVAAVLGLTANYVVCFGLKAAGCVFMGRAFHPFLLGGMGLVVCVAVAWLASFVLREKGRDLKGLTLKNLV